MKFTTYLAENMFDGNFEGKLFSDTIGVAMRNAIDKVNKDFFEKIENSLNKLEGVTEVKFHEQGGASRFFTFKWNGHEGLATVSNSGNSLHLKIIKANTMKEETFITFTAQKMEIIEERLKALKKKLWKNDRERLLDI